MLNEQTKESMHAIFKEVKNNYPDLVLTLPEIHEIEDCTPWFTCEFDLKSKRQFGYLIGGQYFVHVDFTGSIQRFKEELIQNVEELRTQESPKWERVFQSFKDQGSDLTEYNPEKKSLINRRYSELR